MPLTRLQPDFLAENRSVVTCKSFLLQGTIMAALHSSTKLDKIDLK